MIWKMRETDLETVADIWLNTNIKAHGFISPQYWRSNFETVKKMLSEAELYVYADENGVQGFIGLDSDYIAGIFVRSEAQSSGIGKHLLDFVKTAKGQLTLNVYQKNKRAVKFYQREHFKIQCEKIDGNTGEKEYFMRWER